MRPIAMLRGAHATLSRSRLMTSRQMPHLQSGFLRLAAPSACGCRYESNTSSTGSTKEPGVMKSMLPDIQFPKENLAQYIMKDFSKFGDKPALVDGPSGRTISFAQMQSSVQRVSSALVRMGFSKGDVVTVISPNVPEYAVIYLAVIAMGGIATCLSPLYTSVELKHAIDLTKSRMCVTIPQLVPVIKEAVKENETFKYTVVFGNADGCVSYEDLLKDDGSLCPDDPTSDCMNEIAALPFSSGTTGLPKAVMLSHHNIISNIEQTSCSDHIMKYDSDHDVLLAALPFFHIFGQAAIMLAGLKNGVKVVTMPKFEPEQFLHLMQGHRVTTLHVAPPIVLFLAKHPYVDMFDLKRMHTMISAAAPAPEAVVEVMVNRLNIKDFAFRQGFGMTECSPVTHVNPRKGFKYGSCGIAVHNTDFKVVDMETGTALGMGEQGELWVRGPQVMLGYLDNPTATHETLDNDGWLHTGDLAYYDEDQHIFITDRLKELIKHKGFQVAPAELENLLLKHQAVADAAVIGIPDLQTGELPRAYVILKPGAEVNEQQLKDFIKGEVASYKQLQGGVEFVETIPKNLTGKILRRQIKLDYLASLK